MLKLRVKDINTVTGRDKRKKSNKNVHELTSGNEKLRELVLKKLSEGQVSRAMGLLE